MFDILLLEQEFQYLNYFKRSVCKIDLEDLNEKWKHPLVIDMKEKIQDQYGVRVKGVFVNLYNSGDDYAPYHKDSYENINGVFMVSIGGSREFLTKNDETNKITKYLLEDGDLLFFNNHFNNIHKHSIPKRKKMNDKRISVVYYV